MSIDAALLDYSAELITESGAVYRLDNALLSFSWEEQEGQLAQKAMLTIVNAAIGSKWIMSYAKIRAIGEKLFANSGKKRYNEFEVKKDVKH